MSYASGISFTAILRPLDTSRIRPSISASSLGLLTRSPWTGRRLPSVWLEYSRWSWNQPRITFDLEGVYILNVIENADIVKKAYPTANIYNGPLQEVVTAFNLLIVDNMNSLPKARRVPTVGMLSIPDHGVGKREEQMQEDLKIFDSLQDIIDTKEHNLDFLVLTFPIWVFCEDAYVRLFKGISTLLEFRYCVQMKEVSFAEHGIPQDRKCIILLASAVYPPYQWKELLDNNAERSTLLNMDSVVTLSHPPGRTKHPGMS